MRRLCAWVFLASICFAQRVIYNPELDRKGQDAAAAAAAISSDALTARSIENLATIERHQIETALDAARNTMRLRIGAFDQWENVYTLIGDVQEQIAILESVTPPTVGLTTRRDEVRASAARLKAAVEAQEERAKEQEEAERKRGIGAAQAVVDTAVAHIGDVNSLLDFAGQIPALHNIAGGAAVAQIEDGLRELKVLIDVGAEAIRTAKRVRVDPHSLMPSREVLMLRMLVAESDSLKERIALRARMKLETGDLLQLAAETRRKLESIDDCVAPCAASKLSASKRRIADTLAEGDVPRKETLLLALYEAAAVAGQGQTPEAVLGMRDTIAMRRLDLRRNAIYNAAYEQALQAASTRLAAYYAAGIRPNQIAQLLYYLSGIVSLPAIAF